jgi:hypothetical protein
LIHVLRAPWMCWTPAWKLVVWNGLCSPLHLPQWDTVMIRHKFSLLMSHIGVILSTANAIMYQNFLLCWISLCIIWQTHVHSFFCAEEGLNNCPCLVALVRLCKDRSRERGVESIKRKWDWSGILHPIFRSWSIACTRTKQYTAFDTICS